MALSKEFSRELEKAIEVANRHTAELLRLPGVQVVGVGSQRVKGKLTGKAAIIITVKEKLSAKELKERGWQELPRTIEDIPVDVVVSREVVATESKETEAAVKVKDSLVEAWLGRENITGLGVGSKVTEGRFTGVVSIHFYVSEKLSPEELKERGLENVPETIEGIPTDVIQLKPQRVLEGASGHRDDRFDTLVGGISIGLDSKLYSYGTLGALAFDASNNPIALSNEHVWDGSVGQNVVQPGVLGLNGFEPAFQLDVCFPLNFFRLDTPNTVGGSILAGAAAAAALAAALSDDIDPTREGQEATVPPAGALTLEEFTDVKIDYEGFPIPGTPFTTKTTFNYERRTDAGNFPFSASHKRKNRHYLLFSKLLTDRTHYNPDDVIRLFGILIQDPANKQKEPVPCDRFHCVAHLYPVGKDEDYPVVLRPWQTVKHEPSPGTGDDRYYSESWIQSRKREVNSVVASESSIHYGTGSLNDQLSEEEMELIRKYREYLCIYYGEIPASNLPLGGWKKWMYVQTVNDVPPGTDPLEAAKTIGGLPVSQNFRTNLDIACGPFVFEDDGSFDIELFSI